MVTLIYPQLDDLKPAVASPVGRLHSETPITRQVSGMIVDLDLALDAQSSFGASMASPETAAAAEVAAAEASMADAAALDVRLSSPPLLTHPSYRPVFLHLV